MAGIANGMAYHGGVRPFVATFFCFSDYMRPSVRLAALNQLSTIFVWTHDSIGLGEDGPTHQAVEHLMSLRAMPGFSIIRPGDANETAEAWRAAMEHREGAGRPGALPPEPAGARPLGREGRRVARRATSWPRPPDGTPQRHPDRRPARSSSSRSAAARSSRPRESRRASSRCRAGSSSTVQPREYREEVLPPSVRTRLSIEAGVTLGWQKYVGDRGGSIGVDRYGASAPGESSCASTASRSTTSWTSPAACSARKEESHERESAETTGRARPERLVRLHPPGPLRPGRSSSELISEDGLKGMTSNPTIFQNAIAKSDLYDDDIRTAAPGRTAAAIFEQLAVTDVRGGGRPVPPRLRRRRRGRRLRLDRGAARAWRATRRGRSPRRVASGRNAAGPT